jgi:hypothetical protein
MANESKAAAVRISKSTSVDYALVKQTKEPHGLESNDQIMRDESEAQGITEGGGVAEPAEGGGLE